MREPLPLATIHDALLEFLRGRDDAVVFGAHAVNAYVDEPRMTQDVDLLSTRAAELAEEVRAHLAQRFTIALRVRVVAGGKGFRIFQLRRPKNRHLVDVRQVTAFPPCQRIFEISVPLVEELIAQKIISYANRQEKPKGDTDRRDLKMLLLAYPQLKTEAGPVADRLNADEADSRAIEEWKRLVASTILPETDEDEF